MLYLRQNPPTTQHLFPWIFFQEPFPMKKKPLAWEKIKKTYEEGIEKFYKITINDTIIGFFMLEKIQAMLAEALNLPVEKVTADAKIVDDLGADSLDVVELLSQLEDEYGVVIPDDEVESLVTVADVAAQIEKLVK